MKIEKAFDVKDTSFYICEDAKTADDFMDLFELGYILFLQDESMIPKKRVEVEQKTRARKHDRRARRTDKNEKARPEQVLP